MPFCTVYHPVYQLIRQLMMYQVYGNPELIIRVDCMNKSSIEIKLKEELKFLQNKFHKGYELTLKYLPNEIRYNDNNKPLAGEIVNDIIIIYEAKEAKAIQALYHEFIEYLIIPLLKDSFYIISYQNKIITQLLLNKKEEIVEQLSNALRERAFND